MIVPELWLALCPRAPEESLRRHFMFSLSDSVHVVKHLHPQVTATNSTRVVLMHWSPLQFLSACYTLLFLSRTLRTQVAKCSSVPILSKTDRVQLNRASTVRETQACHQVRVGETVQSCLKLLVSFENKDFRKRSCRFARCAQPTSSTQKTSAIHVKFSAWPNKLVSVPSHFFSRRNRIAFCHASLFLFPSKSFLGFAASWSRAISCRAALLFVACLLHLGWVGDNAAALRCSVRSILEAS